tara:strand:- start:1981 stop:2322 length:342 start_codon:yes stop_codon:yes gene_type:complete
MKYALLLTALLATSSQAVMVDGNYLHGQLKKQTDNNTSWGFTRGYVAGVVDANGGVAFCPPAPATLGQITSMTEKYLDDNPAVRHISAEAIIVHMLKKVWPCADRVKGKEKNT